MHKLFICGVILSILATGVAAAVDYHHHLDDRGPEHAGHAGDEEFADVCEQCCHLAGHLLGIVMVDRAGSERGADCFQAHARRDSGHFPTPPPTPPPNS
ncbi:MAG: hypothetical protein ACE5G3_11105 [Gammaproteobacteria bacterium]